MGIFESRYVLRTRRYAVARFTGDEDRPATDMSEIEFVTHRCPIWKDQADCCAHVRQTDMYGTTYEEALASRSVHDNLVQICSIPFCTYNINLGDVVEIGESRQVFRVVERSKFRTYRVFDNTDEVSPTSELWTCLVTLQCLVEQFTSRCVGVAVERGDDLARLQLFLRALQADGEVEWEHGAQPDLTFWAGLE